VAIVRRTAYRRASIKKSTVRKECNRAVLRDLRQLGLSTLASRLYLLILEKRRTSAESLRRAAGVSVTAFRLAIRQLLENRLVVEDLDADLAFTYEALNPRVAFPAIYREHLWDLKASTDLALDGLSEDDRAALAKLKETCDRLSEHLRLGVSMKAVVSPKRILIADTPEKMALALVQALGEARNRILCTSAPPRQPQLSLIWQAIYDRIRHGVSYSRITDLSDLAHHGYRVVWRDIVGLGIDLSVVELDRIRSKYYVVDDDCVALFWPRTDSAEKFSLCGQVIRSATLTKHYSADHFALKDRAIEVRRLLPIMQKKRASLLDRARTCLPRDAIPWLECVLDFGVFCRLPGITDEQIEEFLNSAVGSGLIRLEKVHDSWLPVASLDWGKADLRKLSSNENLLSTS